MFREVCRRLNLPFALAVGALLLSSPWTGAQVAGLHGTITGPSGALVPNARISIKNLDTNNTTAITADVRGSYSSSDLPPGNYSVTVSMTGFLDVTASIAVTVGKQSVLNFTLQSANNQPGHKTPATSSMGGVVSSETVRDMPVNGRDWTQAATLQAGVSSVRTQPDATNTSSGRGQRGFGAQISVSGGRRGGILGRNQQLSCYVWAFFRRSYQRRDSLWKQRVSWHGVRVLAQQCSGRAQFF